MNDDRARMGYPPVPATASEEAIRATESVMQLGPKALGDQGFPKPFAIPPGIAYMIVKVLKGWE